MLAIATLLVLASQARTIHQLDQGYDLPDHTLDGIVCGQCTGWERRGGSKIRVRHASVAHVAYCFGKQTAMDAEAAAERAAELAVERYFEERGAQEDPRERELWALEDARRAEYDPAERDLNYYSSY